MMTSIAETCSDQVRIRNSSLIPLEGIDKPAEFFTFYGLEDHKEHVLIALGNWEHTTTPLVRLHSECLTGDIFHSEKCDCGAQLKEAMAEINKQGGFLLYLRQEGRGIGLYNKIDAYRLQSEGIDTFKANRMLGFADDERDFKVAADMLLAMGHSTIRLLSNNRDKVEQLEQNGIRVKQRQSTLVHQTSHNLHYLRIKIQQADHAIKLV